MTKGTSKLRVIVAGGGVAALETALALAELARELTEVTVVAPSDEFVYRPLAVREPFAYAKARRYELEPIVSDAGATLLADAVARVDRMRRTLHTESGDVLEYDTLVLALGARARVRYQHAITIDDRRLDELLHGVIQDVEGGYISSLAFLAPPRMAWPLPLYELALMTAARAYDAGIELETTVLTAEDSPLAIFGRVASDGVSELLSGAGVRSITSAYCEVPSPGEIVINPGDHRLRADRVIALPELYGPCVRGVPLGSHGFLATDIHGRVRGVEDVYAAGDATEFPVKHGGIASQQADAVAESIAARAGAALTPQPFHPIIRGILLTGDAPRYLTARVTGGSGFDSEFSTESSWSPASKIAAKYLGPYLAARERDSAGAV